MQIFYFIDKDFRNSMTLRINKIRFLDPQLSQKDLQKPAFPSNEMNVVQMQRVAGEIRIAPNSNAPVGMDMRDAGASFVSFDFLNFFISAAPNEPDTENSCF